MSRNPVKKVAKKPVKKPVKKPSAKEGKKPVSRMKAYIERQKERGMVNVCVWVPEEDAHDLRRMADKLRRNNGIVSHRSVALYGKVK